MKILNIQVRKMLAVLLSVILSLNLACAVELTKGISKSVPLTQAYVWYDGDRERTVWLNPQIVAEFNPGPQGESSVKSASASAQVLPVKRSQAAVRLWQMKGTAATAISSLKTIHPQGKYSAVLQDGPGGTGRMRALPGNIVVYLDPQWNQAAVNHWLNLHKLEIVKKVEIGPNIYVIKTGPGLEALTTANALYKSGEVKAAFPDWWQEVVTR